MKQQLRKSAQFKQSVLKNNKKGDYQRLNGLFSPSSTFKENEVDLDVSKLCDYNQDRMKAVNEYFGMPSTKYKSIRQVSQQQAAQRNERNKVRSAQVSSADRKPAIRHEDLQKLILKLANREANARNAIAQLSSGLDAQ